MPSIFSFLNSWLFGKLPKTSNYEQHRTLLQKQYFRYKELKQTENLRRYQELATQVATPHIETGLSKKERKQNCKELKSLRKTKDVKDFFRLQRNSHNFNQIANWDLKFEDNFNYSDIEESKWLSRWCVQGVEFNANYSPANELHVFTEDNIEFNGQALKIHTKEEPSTGLGFSEIIGFTPIEREYSSAIVNTGKELMLQYGKIEVKFRFTLPKKGFYHAFWLGAGRKLPHVNMLRIGSKLEFSEFAKSESEDEETLEYVKLWQPKLLKKKAYYILAVEWLKDEIKWSINGKKIFVAPNLIHEPMYVALSSGVTHTPEKNHSNGLLEVDWIKVYQQHESI
ncbi:MAG: glycoside hydrolase family 16 protein [Bacteroidales bacterium]